MQGVMHKLTEPLHTYNRTTSLKHQPSVGVHTQPRTQITNLHITSYNCRGITSCIPYIHHLIANGCDIIVLSERLWPYQLHKLKQIHPDFDGCGTSDTRLNEHSTLTH